MGTTERVRPNRSQVVRIELPCIFVSWCPFAQEMFQTTWLCGLKHFLFEGALRHRNTRELYSNNLRAVGPNTLSCAHQLKTKQNRKQDNKTKQASEQGK